MVNSGKKISLEDMKTLQLDVVDVHARDLTPQIIKLSERAVQNLSATERKEL